MNRRKSTRETKHMIQTALWLPRDMHEQLKKDGGERGLGDEIRRRLQISFDEEQVSTEKTTRGLLDGINRIAQILSLAQPWHANRDAFDAFKAAINELLSDHQPSTEAQPESLANLKPLYGRGPDERPETIGRILARVVMADMYLKRGDV
jgi:hypothetical protein